MRYEDFEEGIKVRLTVDIDSCCPMGTIVTIKERHKVCPDKYCGIILHNHSNILYYVKYSDIDPAILKWVDASTIYSIIPEGTTVKLSPASCYSNQSLLEGIVSYNPTTTHDHAYQVRFTDGYTNNYRLEDLLVQIDKEMLERKQICSCSSKEFENIANVLECINCGNIYVNGRLISNVI